MIIYMFEAEEGTINFGDELNRHIWRRHAPELALAKPEDAIFVGIGTMLHRGFSVKENVRNVIFGAGSTGDYWCRLDKVYFVRGPKTAEFQGLDPSMSITDPAIVVSTWERPKTVNGKIVYVPHWTSMEEVDLRSRCDELGVVLVDPRLDCMEVFNEIASAEFVVGEAMHAVIVSDALRIPWVAVNTGNPEVNRFKWEDWCASMEVEYSPASDIESALKSIRRLSYDHVFENRLSRVLKKIEILRKDISKDQLVYEMSPVPYSPYIKNNSECGGIRVVLAVPTYGPSPQDCQRAVRGAVMYAANRGVRWAGDGSPDRMSFSAARNLVAEAIRHRTAFLGADGIMWIDSDMRPEPHHIAQLLMEVNKRDLDFLTGMYYQRNPPHECVVGRYNKSRTRMKKISEYTPNVIAPINGTGFGFCYTSRRAIDVIAESAYFDSTTKWFPDTRDQGGWGEDYGFCDLAEKCGIELYAHTGIEVDHMSDPIAVSRETYLDHLRKIGVPKDAKRVEVPDEIRSE